jgi:predicted dehydrogenase
MIIGCGQIGALYDNPEKREILTHAHSFATSGLISEFVLVDSNQDQLDKASALWKTKGYKSIQAALDDSFLPDIACVATPPQTHLGITKELIKAGVKKIILEKPVALNMEEALEIEDLVSRNGIHLNVNYPRRFDYSMAILAKDINSQKFGKLETVRCLYTKGTLNSGSHIINLLLFLLGEIKDKKILSSINDYSIDDPTISCLLSFGRCHDVYLIATNSKNYFITEYEFIFEKARFTFFDRGFQYRFEEVRKDPTFPGYYDLELTKTERTKLDDYLKILLEDTLNNHAAENMTSNLRDANESMRICLDLINLERNKNG